MTATTFAELFEEERAAEAACRERMDAYQRKCEREDNEVDPYDDLPDTCEQARLGHRALVAQLKIHPQDRYDRDGVLGCTMVVCSHSYHGVETYYFDMDQWSEHFMNVTGPLWVNGYTMVCQPMG